MIPFVKCPQGMLLVDASSDDIFSSPILIKTLSSAVLYDGPDYELVNKSCWENISSICSVYDLECVPYYYNLYLKIREGRRNHDLLSGNNINPKLVDSREVSDHKIRIRNLKISRL